MERFLTALVFCGTPLDAYSTVSTSVMTTGSVSKLVSGGTLKPSAHKVDAEEKKQGYSGGPTLRPHAGFQLTFGGLNCFDAVPYENAHLSCRINRNHTLISRFASCMSR